MMPEPLELFSAALAALALFLVVRERKIRKNSERKSFLQSALLGEKQTIAYVAYKIAKSEGFTDDELLDLLPTLCIAFVFTKSSRTRALILKAIKEVPKKFRKAMLKELSFVEDVFLEYQESKLESDTDSLKKYLERIQALNRIIS